MELSYAGLFQIEGMPEDALEPFLLVNCPALLFPFFAAAGVRYQHGSGGFPPLLLDPIDFASLFIARKQRKRERRARRPTLTEKSDRRLAPPPTWVAGHRRARVPGCRLGHDHELQPQGLRP